MRIVHVIRKNVNDTEGATNLGNIMQNQNGKDLFIVKERKKT